MSLEVTDGALYSNVSRFRLNTKAPEVSFAFVQRCDLRKRGIKKLPLVSACPAHPDRIYFDPRKPGKRNIFHL